MQSLVVEALQQGKADAPTDEAVAVGELHATVLSAIEALPAIYREPFVLRHVNGWSYQEIADAMVARFLAA